MAIESVRDSVRMTRGALAAAGFARHENDGVVWWTKGDRDERDTIVLIHGANDHAGTWFSIAAPLAENNRVIIPDLAGHGESKPADGPIPISLIQSQLTFILSGERDLTLVGNSLGGWMAMLYTLTHPAQVTRLFLEASGGLDRPLSVPIFGETREEAMVILRAVHGPAFAGPEWVIEALLERAKGSPILRLTELDEHRVEARLREVRVPTKLIWGADDGVVPLSYGEALRDAIPGAALCVIEGAAHIPHLQQPQRFLECLTQTS